MAADPKDGARGKASSSSSEREAQAEPKASADERAPANPTTAAGLGGAAKGGATVKAKAEGEKPSHWLWTLRSDPPFWASKALGVGAIVLVVLVWYLFTMGDSAEERFISPSKLPNPVDVIGAYGSLVDRGLWEGITATLKRIIGGFALAGVVGITVGVLAGSFRAISSLIQPFVLFGRSLPLAALIPLTIVWFGIEDRQKMMFIFIAAVPFVVSDTIAAITAVPQRYVETAETLGATRFQIIRKVLVPLALPDVVTSLRFLFGLALGYVMLAEVINASQGLGALIIVSQKRSRLEDIYFLLIVIGLLAFLIDRSILWFQRRIFPYRTDV